MLEILKKARSYRRFQQKPIEMDFLEELVEMARFSPSGANSQPLRYVICNDEEVKAKLFPCIAWAGALKDWDGPVEGEKPMAYIMIVSEKQGGINTGIAAQTIVLGAMSKGIGACMIGALNREQAAEAVNLDSKYNVELLIALGYPGERVVVDDVKEGDSLKYYRDDQDVHHVPKIVLDDMIVKKIASR